MNRRTYTYATLAAVLGFTSLAGAFTLRLAAPDYSAIPPAPSEAQRQLETLSFTLTEAIEKVREETGGVAQSASFDLSASPPTVTVKVYAEGRAKRVVINAQSQEIVSREDVPRFPGWPVEGEWTETESGLKYYDIEVGEGAQPEGSGSVVTVHYSGWLVDGTKFASSVDHGAPAPFPLGKVIPGWTEGVGSMRVGGKRKLIIPYRLAYGEEGRPGAIPPRATLIFDVELLDVRDWPQTPGQPGQPGQPGRPRGH